MYEKKARYNGKSQNLEKNVEQSSFFIRFRKNTAKAHDIPILGMIFSTRGSNFRPNWCIFYDFLPWLLFKKGKKSDIRLWI